MPELVALNVLELSRIRNPGTDYVSLILELWLGDREDLATYVDRYIAVFPVDSVPEQLAIEHRHSGFDLNRVQQDVCLIWRKIARVKEADGEARRHQEADERMVRQADANWGGHDAKLYTAFLDAIDKLAVNYEDAEAWKAIDAWRNYNATKHEK